MTETPLEDVLTDLITAKVPRHLRQQMDHSLALVQEKNRSLFLRRAVERELVRHRKQLAQEGGQEPGESAPAQDPHHQWTLNRLGRDIVEVQAHLPPKIFSLEETFGLCQQYGPLHVLEWLRRLEGELSLEAENEQKFVDLLGADVFRKATPAEQREGFDLVTEFETFGTAFFHFESPPSAEEDEREMARYQAAQTEILKKMASFREGVRARPKAPDGDPGPDPDSWIEDIRARAHKEIPLVDEEIPLVG